jgi:hypothetical protein
MGCECARENDRTNENGVTAYPPLTPIREEAVDSAYRPCRQHAFQPESSENGSNNNSSRNCKNESTDSTASPVQEEKKYNLEHLREWYRNREDWRIAVWMNAPANAGAVAQMDQDIARLRHYAPNSPELALLLQLRGLRSEQLERRTT